MPDDILVIGTDTGVGKTVVSLLLMQLLYAKGHQPHYFKPFQTGCAHPHDIDSDARFVYDHTAALKGNDPSQSMLYCHASAKAPYFAARDAGETIDPAEVMDYLAVQRKRYTPLVVEAAGGLMVPVTQGALMVDILAPLACRPLLVARSGLGTINHTLLSIEALRLRRMEPFGVVLTEGSPTPTNSQLVLENMEAIAAFGRVAVLGVIDHISDFNSPPSTVFDPLKAFLA